MDLEPGRCSAAWCSLGATGRISPSAPSWESLRPNQKGKRVFTGIVSRTCRIASWSTPEQESEGERLVLEPRALAAVDGDLEPWGDVQLGESIAVNGCCLTVVDLGHGIGTGLGFDVIEESLRRTSLGDLEAGAAVNLERSLRVGDRLGGHYVTGHVDAIGRIAERRVSSKETLVRVEVEGPGNFAVIAKGSVAIDGVSLTVVDASSSSFSVALIPHTLAVTSLGTRQDGERVNLEMDHIAKWVRHLVNESGGTS